MRLAILVLATFSAISAVAGLGAVFSGIYYPIMAAGIGIELGKYGLVAYSYQNWQTFTTKLKILIVISVVFVSCLTSIGIFGYLSASSRDVRLSAGSHKADMQALVIEKGKYESQIAAIDQQVASLPNQFVEGRLRLMQGFNDQRKTAFESLQQVNESIKQLRVSDKSKVDLGPIQDVAAAFGVSVESAVNNMMLALVLALDPFALFLTVLVNRKRVSEGIVKVEPIEEVVEAITPVKEVSTDEWHFK